MKKNKFKKSICLAVLALTLVVGVCSKSAMAYFTTYVEAQGSVEVDLGFTETKPNDDVKKNIKTVSITNDKEFPCFVRMKIFVGNKFAELVKYQPGSGWSLENGYYEYDAILEPHATTSDFIIKLEDAFNLKPSEDDLREFNVIVIQESAPVRYDEDEMPYAEWNTDASGSESGEGDAK